ncbi:MAG: M1 family aminopeptidase [Candidatus Kapaibacterium sp.]
MKTTVLLILILACMAAMGQNLSAEDIIPNPQKYQDMPFDVLSYELNLDLRDYKTKTVIGICTVKVTRNYEVFGNYFIFHLNSLKISSLYMNGVESEYSSYGNEGDADFHYKTAFPEDAGDTVIYIINYSGKMSAETNGVFNWGGVHYEEGATYSLGVGFHAPYISMTRHWMPCFDLPQDKALFKGTFRVPEDIVAASNGLLKELNILDDGSKEYVWVHDFPAATYLLAFAVARYTVVNNFDYKLPLEIYSLQVDSARSEFVYSEVPAMNDCFESYFGDYPFEKIAYANVTKGAMEHQTLISMPRSLVVNLDSKKNSNNETAAHELSHMWFGNMVSPKDFRDVWLNESFATYCESLWNKCRNGNSAYLSSQKTKLENYLNFTIKEEGVLPLYDFSRTVPSSNYPQTIYIKGAVIVGMLNYILNRDYEAGLSLITFEEFISNYLSKYAYSNVNTDEFISLLSESTGHNYDKFAEQWIYGVGYPKFDIIFDDLKYDKYSNGLSIIQVQEGIIYTEVPLELTFYVDGNEFTKVFMIDDEVTHIKLEDISDYSIDSLVANSGKEVVALYEINNIGTATSVNRDLHSKIEFFHSNGQIIINYSSVNGLAEFSLINTLGEIIKLNNAGSKPGMNSITINLSDYPQGVYILSALIDGQQFTEKISIIR